MSVYNRRGPIVRVMYLAVALAAWGILTAVRALGFRRNEILVLCYHGVTGEQKDRFARQMRTIASRAVDVSALRADPPTAGRQPRIGVTFDDGFLCVLAHALPILRRLHIPVTVFPVTGNLGRVPRWKIAPERVEVTNILMSADQVRSAGRDPVCRFGSHTHRHLNLARALPSTIRRELAESKACLEHLLGTIVEDLALPYGDYTPEVIDHAIDAGYKRIFTLDPEVIAPRRPPVVIGRFSMSPDVWPIEFRLTCAGAYAWLGTWRRAVRGVRKIIAPRPAKELSST